MAGEGGGCLVGVDGGASTLRAWRIRRVGAGALEESGPVARRSLPRDPGFRPPPLTAQVADLEDGGPRLTPGESLRSEQILEAVHEVICTAAGPPGLPLVLGICLPGRKDEAGRSVVAARHGARLPEFVDALLARLAADGYEFAGRPVRLRSDGRAAAFGECFARGGALAGVETGLYLGGGTGVAEGLVLGGTVVPSAEQYRILEPVWNLGADSGEVYEDLVSMAAVNRTWNGDDPVEEAAAAGSDAARALLRTTALHLADLLDARRTTVRRATGQVVQRIVLGQRTADLYLSPTLRPWFAAPLEKRLASRQAEGEDPAMRPLLVASPRHAAPALGAVASTLGWWDEPRGGSG